MSLQTLFVFVLGLTLINVVILIIQLCFYARVYRLKRAKAVRLKLEELEALRKAAE